jgi:hypothetical protein
LIFGHFDPSIMPPSGGFFIPRRPMKETASAVAKTAPSWLATVLSWGDANFPRILLILSIAYTALQIYSAIRRLRKGGSNVDE